MYWELVSHIRVLTGLKSAVNLSIADSSKKEESEKMVLLDRIHWNMELFSCLWHGAKLSQKNEKYQKSGANDNRFRTWHDSSASQASCRMKIVIDNFTMLRGKFLQHTSLLLPSAELFLHLVTALGSSSHSTRGRHRARMPLHNHMLGKIRGGGGEVSYVKTSCDKGKIRKCSDNCKRRYKQVHALLNLSTRSLIN